MQTICLFGGDYATAAQVHLAEHAACPSLWVNLTGPEEVVSCLRLVSRVFRENGADVKEL